MMREAEMLPDVAPAHFVSNSFKYAVGRSVHWTLRTTRTFITGGRSDYVALTPPFLSRQIVLERSTGQRFIFNVRDESDYCSLENVFLEEDYRLARLARNDEIAGWYERAVQGGQTPLIVDCGANIGLSAAYFSTKFPQAKLIAVEPNEANLRMARRNCPSPDVHFVHAGVASECKKGRLVDPGRGNDAFRVEADGAGALDLVSIDSLLDGPAAAGCVPFIVKIDVEGFEEELFSKNVGWIERFPLLVIELHDWMLPRRCNSRNFLATISALDRDFVYIGENVFSISNAL